MQHVFIIGSKGIPARYGGFETFVENLTKHQKSAGIKYHVSCIETEEMKDRGAEFEHNGAHCFQISIPNIGAAKAVIYDILSFQKSIRMIKEKKIKSPIVYVLACRMGPFVGYYKHKLHKAGGKYFVNPDGHEWKRDKWNALIKKYWKLSEKLMIKHADFVICDSKNIESYVQKDYAKYHPKTTFVAYGADVEKSTIADDDKKYTDWMKDKGLRPNEYYLLVGRLVPENNYETILKEFVKSDTNKKLVLVTTVAKKSYMDRLKENTGYVEDNRVIFAGTVYDSELLKKIRENAFAYIHGHEVGGTNPSLLEALGSTKLNILLDVGFNKEVAEDGAIYFNKEDGNLRSVMKAAENFTREQILDYEDKAKNRVKTQYSHEIIVEKYENIFSGM